MRRAVPTVVASMFFSGCSTAPPGPEGRVAAPAPCVSAPGGAVPGRPCPDAARAASDRAAVADVATSAIGLPLGLSEANPLGVLVLPLKAITRARIDSIPDEQQRRETWARFASMQSGAAAANVCSILAIDPAIAAACFAVGAIVSYRHVRALPLAERALVRGHAASLGGKAAQCLQSHLQDLQQAAEARRSYVLDLLHCEGRVEEASR